MADRALARIGRRIAAALVPCVGVVFPALGLFAAEPACVRVDGSSTVFPISEAAADEFNLANEHVRVTVAFSGTGGGFECLLAGSCDIANASRPISPAEASLAQERNVAYVEIPIARDGLTMTVNPANDWVDRLTVDELRRIWAPDSRVQRWSDVRPDWPGRPIHLYGPGPASGSFDHFTEWIGGRRGALRDDHVPHEDDYVLAQAVATDANALAYFGYTYYVQHRDRIRAVPIDSGTGPVAPSAATIASGAYRPLSRLLFVYVRVDALSRPAVASFLEFYLAHAPVFVTGVGAVALAGEAYELSRRRLRARCAGSVFGTLAADHGDVARALAADRGCREGGAPILNPSGSTPKRIRQAGRGAGERSPGGR
jgi:phosphate transport system substrate-binding protein